MSDGQKVPYGIKADVEHLPDGNVALRLTYAATEEAYDAGNWEVACFLLGPATARELASNLANHD